MSALLTSSEVELMETRSGGLKLTRFFLLTSSEVELMATPSVNLKPLPCILLVSAEDDLIQRIFLVNEIAWVRADIELSLF